MNDKEFLSIMNQLGKYLASDKMFIENPFRVTEIKKAAEIVAELFPEAKKEFKDDPLQMGAMILHIEDYDLDVCSEKEIELFAELIKIADCWEIYTKDNGNVCIAAVFKNALIRI